MNTGGDVSGEIASVEEINRAINRALRALNDAGVALVATSTPVRDAAMEELTRALSHTDNLQRLIVSVHQELEYHYDPNRQPTPAMKAISELVDLADREIRDGNRNSAIAALERACATDPPPLIYEMLQKRIRDLQSPDILDQ